MRGCTGPEPLQGRPGTLCHNTLADCPQESRPGSLRQGQQASPWSLLLLLGNREPGSPETRCPWVQETHSSLACCQELSPRGSMLPSSKSQQESTRRLQNLCDKFRATKRVIGKSPLSPSQNHGAGVSPRKRDAKGLLQPQWELLPEQLDARLPLPRLAPGAITPSHQSPGQSYLIPSLKKGACQPAPPQCGLQLSTPCPTHFKAAWWKAGGCGSGERRDLACVQREVTLS